MIVLLALIAAVWGEAPAAPGQKNQFRAIVDRIVAAGLELRKTGDGEASLEWVEAELDRRFIPQACRGRRDSKMAMRCLAYDYGILAAKGAITRTDPAEQQRRGAMENELNMMSGGGEEWNNVFRQANGAEEL